MKSKESSLSIEQNYNFTEPSLSAELIDIINQFRQAKPQEKAKIIANYPTIDKILELAKECRPKSLLAIIKAKLLYYRAYLKIKSSKLFDANWYRTKYLTNEHNITDELEHFLTVGTELGFDPIPNFATRFYLQTYWDVKISGVNPLLHYILSGKNEGRLTHPSQQTTTPADQLVTDSKICFSDHCSNEEIRKKDLVYNTAALVHLHCCTVETYQTTIKLINLPENSTLLVACQSQAVYDQIQALNYATKKGLQVKCLVSNFSDQPLQSLLNECNLELSAYQQVCHIHDQLPEHACLAKKPVVHELIKTLIASENLIYCVRNFLNQVHETILTPMPILDYPKEPLLFWANTKQLLKLADSLKQNNQITNLTTHQECVDNVYTLCNSNKLRLVSYRPEKQFWAKDFYSKHKPYQGKSYSVLIEDIANYNSQKNQPNKIAIYTCITNNYNQLKIPEYLNSNCDYICFSNQAVEAYGLFQIRKINYYNINPIKVARYVKTHPHELLPEYDLAIWLDSSALIRNDLNPYIEILNKSEQAIAMIPHPVRSNLAQEAVAVAMFTGENLKVIARQLARYPKNTLHANNLHETGFIIMRHKQKNVSDFLNLWWQEIEQHSSRDQLSLSYALEQSGLEVAALMENSENLRSSADFALFSHGLDNGYARDA